MLVHDDRMILDCREKVKREAKALELDIYQYGMSVSSFRCSPAARSFLIPGRTHSCKWSLWPSLPRCWAVSWSTWPGSNFPMMSVSDYTLPMQITPYLDVNELLDHLLSQMQRILGKKLVGLYLYGSLVSGDFDDNSDVDLLAVTSSDIDEWEFCDLQEMQNEWVAQNEKWDDRIEIAYLSATALQTFRSHTSQIAIVSPGEPFHVKQAGCEWLVNWYMVREQGLVLFGPSPTTLIAPISKEEFIQTVQEHTQAWGEWIHHMHGQKSQAYAILTLCRALYACHHGEQASKKQAAYWTAQELPHWSSLVQKALLWREMQQEEDVDRDATFPETLRFVQFVIEHIGARCK
jgi:predicted nucleotidyltransferase